MCVCANSLQLCPAPCDPVDCSPLGSSVHGILQAKILEWVAIPSSRGSSRPRGSNPCLLHLLHWQVGSLPLAPPGSPWTNVFICNMRLTILPTSQNTCDSQMKVHFRISVILLFLHLETFFCFVIIDIISSFFIN